MAQMATKMEQQNEIIKMLRNGQTEEAIRQLKSWLPDNRESADRLYYLLGNAYRQQGDFRQALGCYLEAMSINPESPAVEAHQMLTDIIEFYHKDYYNP